VPSGENGVTVILKSPLSGEGASSGMKVVPNGNRADCAGNGQDCDALAQELYLVPDRKFNTIFRLVMEKHE
jgi:hypothetical protein